MSEIGLIGKKIGMTREFYKTGQSVPVTVIKTEKGRLSDTQKKWLETSEQLNTPHYVLKGSVEANLSLLEGIFALFPNAARVV